MSRPGITAGLVLLLLATGCGRPEPTFCGRPANAWARSLMRPAGRDGLASYGTDAVPILVEIATRRYDAKSLSPAASRAGEPSGRARDLLREIDEAAIPAVILAFETGDPRTRATCLSILGELAPTSPEAFLAESETDAALGLDCVSWLGPDAAPATSRLTELLESDDAACRVFAARALRAIGAAAAPAAPALRKIAEGPPPAEAEYPVLGTPPEDSDPARKKLHVRVGRREAAAALVKIDPADEVGEGLLLWFLANGDEQEVADAASVLREAGRRVEEAENALRRLLATGGGSSSAAEVLARIGPDAAWATPRLAELLDDRGGANRTQIGWGSHMDYARALGRIGPAAKAALPALEDAMRTHHPRVRPVAALAVYRIGGDVGPVVNALAAVAGLTPDPGKQAVEDAVGALEEIAAGNADARKTLEALTRHPRFAVRRPPGPPSTASTGRSSAPRQGSRLS